MVDAALTYISLATAILGFGLILYALRSGRDKFFHVGAAILIVAVFCAIIAYYIELSESDTCNCTRHVYIPIIIPKP